MYSIQYLLDFLKILDIGIVRSMKHSNSIACKMLLKNNARSVKINSMEGSTRNKILKDVPNPRVHLLIKTAN